MPYHIGNFLATIPIRQNSISYQNECAGGVGGDGVRARALGEGLARGLGFGQGAWGGGHSLLLPAPQDFLGKTDAGNKTIDKLA